MGVASAANVERFLARTAPMLGIAPTDAESGHNDIGMRSQMCHGSVTANGLHLCFDWPASDTVGRVAVSSLHRRPAFFGEMNGARKEV